MAEPALRGTAALQTRAGLRPAHPHRQTRPASRGPHPRLSRNDLLPQQTGVHLCPAPLDDLRGGGRRWRHRRRSRPRIPHPRPVRQGDGRAPLLAPARSVERHPPGDQTLLRGARLLLLRHPPAQRSDAQPGDPHRLDRRSDGNRGLRRGGPAPHRRPARTSPPSPPSCTW